VSGTGGESLVAVLAVGTLAVVPFALLMLTAFVKISVVLSILRSALGAAEIIPTLVITGLAFVLTVFVMAPVGAAAYREARPVLDRAPPADLLSARTAAALVAAAQRGKEPVRAFLTRHAQSADRALFFDLAQRLRSPAERAELRDTDFLVVLPAFVTSELKAAFQIGFLLLIPFLVIDLVVANLLAALGLPMLSPQSVALAFKLLLFVIVGGWSLVARGLVAGYL
jgi:type III secretion protein R